MSLLKRISLFLVLCFLSINGFSQYVRYTEDTAKVAFGLFTKLGVVYDYPFYHNYSDPSPMGEIGLNIVFDKLQIGTGLGFFVNNSYWRQGADAFSPERTGTTKTGNIYIPLHTNIKLFHLKRNFLSMKIGFVFILSTTADITETTIYGTNNYKYTQPRFGLGGTIGFRYSRKIAERILLGVEFDLNLALAPSPAALLGTDYVYGFNMSSRHPNGDVKICFEYIFGKKHINYLDESKRKMKVKEESVIDEE